MYSPAVYALSVRKGCSQAGNELLPSQLFAKIGFHIPTEGTGPTWSLRSLTTSVSAHAPSGCRLEGTPGVFTLFSLFDLHTTTRK